MARWGRAMRLLPPPPARVLDCGCAFGFMTRRLARRYAEVCGIDMDPGYVARARRTVPSADIRLGRVDALPWPQEHFDAAVCLDVLEHCPDPPATVAELARVVRPGGVLVVSVPHRGLLEGADSLNVYARMRPSGDVPTDDPSWPMSPHHRHFSVAELQSILAPSFAVDTVQRTGLGVAELVNLPLLLATRGISRRLRPVYALLQYLYFGVYVAEDVIPLGAAGYHLMVRATRPLPGHGKNKGDQGTAGQPAQGSGGDGD
jgi:SAM-dependent methyltransferase